MLKELLMSSIKGEVKKKHFCIGRNFSCLMTSECWLSHIADSSFSRYYPVALSDTLGHAANEDQVLVRLTRTWSSALSLKAFIHKLLDNIASCYFHVHGFIRPDIR